MRDAVLVDAVRTPVGRRGGALAGAHPVDLSAVVLRALADRVGLDPVGAAPLIVPPATRRPGATGDSAAVQRPRSLAMITFMISLDPP